MFDLFDQPGEFVRSLRRELKMTQEEFAHELGITVGTVNRWENGRFRPSKLARATLMEFAARHGLSIRSLTSKGHDREPTAA
jgi:putative transcriptional regulator